MKQTKTKIPQETTKVVNAVTGESRPIKYIKAKTTDLKEIGFEIVEIDGE